MSTKYIPFLKFKQNEIRALKDTLESSLDCITPFFDIPRDLQENSVDKIKKTLNSGLKELTKKWPNEKSFYMDCMDIPTLTLSDGSNIYYHILKHTLAENLRVIPVIAFNRDPSHNTAVETILNEYSLKNVAIRLDRQDISDPDDFLDNLSDIRLNFKEINVDLFLDIKIIKSEAEMNEQISEILNFKSQIDLKKDFEISKISTPSSSIKYTFSPPKKSKKIKRFEGIIFETLKKPIDNMTYSDYGIVSPEYADSAIPANIMQRVSTPKVIYTEKFTYQTYRGGSFESHPRRKNQFHDIAREIVSSPEYRGSAYSSGDKFIHQKSLTDNNPSSQGQWYRMLNNAHFEYIISDFL